MMKAPLQVKNQTNQNSLQAQLIYQSTSQGRLGIESIRYMTIMYLQSQIFTMNAITCDCNQI